MNQMKRNGNGREWSGKWLMNMAQRKLINK